MGYSPDGMKPCQVLSFRVINFNRKFQQYISNRSLSGVRLFIISAKASTP